MQIGNLRQQAKMIKQRKNTGTCWDEKGKTTQEKMAIRLDGINQKVPVIEGKLKRYRNRIKQYRQNRTFHDNEKILPTSRGRWHEDIPTTGFKGSKTILEQNVATKRTSQKSRMDKQHGKRLRKT